MGVLPRVVIVGAGFAGIEVARGLARCPVEVVLVDRNNFRTFQPLLYQVATAGLNAADVAHATRGLFHRQSNVEVRLGEVSGVDWERRVVLLDGHDPLPYDHLVLAVGVSVSFFGVDGAEEHSYPLYSLHDAIRLRNHVLDRFEAGAADPSLVDDGALNVVVVGAGPTGVETAGALAELFAHVFRKDYKRLDLSRARIVLLEMRDRVLPPFSPQSGLHAADALTHMHVEVRTGVQVASITPRDVTLTTGERIPAQTVVWAAGVQANPLVERLGLDADAGGRVRVDPDLSLPDRANVWIAGDLAHVVDRGRVVPALAPAAMQAGRHVARQIRRTLEREPTRPFRYRNKGTMATIGRNAAVTEIALGRRGTVRLTGFLGWLSWLGLHLVYLVGKRNRASVLLNWAWMYVTWDRGPRLILRVDDREPADRFRSHG